MIDIHCHIVPNIDDGAESLDDALEMAKIAYDEGIRKIVNTSHYHPNFEYKKGKELFESVKEFNNILKLNNLDINQKYYTLLIGGNGAGYKYDNKFYDDLLSFVKKIYEEKDIKWFITTSRRTPIEIENKLEEMLREYYSYFVAYKKKEEKVLLPFFGLSEAIFVTEESSSMISEAISSSKKVFTIGNEYSDADENYKSILKKFELNNQIIRIKNFSLHDNRHEFNNKNINCEFRNFIKKEFR